MRKYNIKNYKKRIHSRTIKKKLQSLLQVLMSTCAVLGWWGFLYPDLTLTPDTVKVDDTASTEAVSDYDTWEFSSSLYRDIICADRSQIVFRSKLLKELRLFWEALQNGNQ